MSSVRCGIGYDLHRLAEGRPLVVGGITVPFDKGPVGHSDGDVLAHALCDALARTASSSLNTPANSWMKER
jgi:2-C-methyl-D-erythritol 2,4-cyclodiphosphate synthase